MSPDVAICYSQHWSIDVRVYIMELTLVISRHRCSGALAVSYSHNRRHRSSMKSCQHYIAYSVERHYIRMTLLYSAYSCVGLFVGVCWLIARNKSSAYISDKIIIFQKGSWCVSLSIIFAGNYKGPTLCLLWYCLCFNY